MNDSEQRWDDEITLYRGEAAAVYCADFQDFPEITNSETMTLHSVAVTSGAALVTISGAAVLVAVFEEKDREGTVEKSVPIGKGIKAALTPTATGGAKGECIVTFFGTMSGGARRGKRLKVTVK